jgi:hypothetical protein
MDAEPSMVGEPINRFGFIYAPVNKEGGGTFFARVAEMLSWPPYQPRGSLPPEATFPQPHDQQGPRLCGGHVFPRSSGRGVY